MKKRTIFLIALVIFFPLNSLPTFASDAANVINLGGFVKNASHLRHGCPRGCLFDRLRDSQKLNVARECLGGDHAQKSHQSADDQQAQKRDAVLFGFHVMSSFKGAHCP